MSDHPARARYAIINASRLAGVALVLAGLLVVEGRTGLPREAAYVLVLLGMIGAFFAPRWLARRWRSGK